MFTARPDAEGDAQKTIEGSEKPHAANTSDVGAHSADSSGNRRNETQISVPIFRIDAGGSREISSKTPDKVTVILLVLPQDLRISSPPLTRHGRTLDIISASLLSVPPSVHQHMESLNFSSSPTFPTCAQAVVRLQNIRCGR